MPAKVAKRIKTGIPGLDGLVGGGFIEGSANLVTGGTGTGKTTFASQFLWQGLQQGDSCVYISLEESPDDIRQDAAMFGWDFTGFEKKGLMRVIYHDPAQVNNLGTIMMNEISRLHAKRLVIDSTAVMGLTLETSSQIRRRVYGIINSVKEHGCTALILSEIPEDSKALSRFGVEEFVADGVIVLNYLGIGEQYSRSLAVRKMRRTNHGRDVYPFEITARGIVVSKAEM